MNQKIKMNHHFSGLCPFLLTVYLIDNGDIVSWLYMLFSTVYFMIVVCHFEIIDVNDLHILYALKNPQIYGLSQDCIQILQFIL